MNRFSNLFRRDERGVALIEFALVMPFLIVVLFGGIELTRYILITQKVAKAAFMMNNVVTQYLPATATAQDGEIDVTEMQYVFLQLDRMMEPFDVPERQVAIATSVVKTAPTTIVVKWQIAGGGSLTSEVASAVNGAGPSNPGGADSAAPFSGADPTLSTMTVDENMVVMEVFYRYEPILNFILEPFDLELPARTLVQRAYFVPRKGALICLPPTYTYTDCL